MKTYILLALFSCFIISSLSSQEKLKDSLFFYLDEKYVFQSKYVPASYLLKDSNNVDRGTFYFERIESVDSISPKEILCLKKVVRSSKFYNKRKKLLDNDGLFEYFNSYIIFLVHKNKKNNTYIKVISNWEIE